ncbi:MAG: Na/Pi symporter [Cyclobacteriaceae bacterium]|nr:Na/Pi symporter [Cyclobacteriaceae bacterium]
MSEQAPVVPTPNRWRPVIRNTAYILGALLIFLFALNLMISSLQHLGKDAENLILQTTSNPFTALFIGLLLTALIQSSSATTTMAVALVASGAMPLNSAIPFIMGANIGTTITSTIVSLGFIPRKKEFRRAVAIGTYHDFFNILTVILLFPLEYYFGFLSAIAGYVGTTLFHEPISHSSESFSLLGWGGDSIIKFIITTINNGFILVVLSVALLFSSIIFFRKVISKTLGFGQQEKFQHFFFKNSFKSFGWGLLTTAIIRSSTITTSLVVPLVAKKVVKIKSAQPFILGANIGTTISAFIAALFNSNAAISLAIAHFLFNAIGVIVFYLVPIVNELPGKLADGLGRLTLKYRLAGFLYLLLTFFVVPFSLIYFNKDAVRVNELTYRHENFVTRQSTSYNIISKTYPHHALSNLLVYDRTPQRNQQPSKILTVYRRNNLLIINNDLFELNRAGFCRDAEDEHGKYRICILEVLPSLALSAELKADSVFVFEKQWYQPERADSARVRLYVSANLNLQVKKEKLAPDGRLLEQELLTGLQSK